MICSLSENQKKGILIATRDILKKSPKATTEDILKKIYDIGYHTLVKANNANAQEYGIAFVQFVAESLDSIAQDEKANSVLSQLGIDLNTQATSNALIYTHIDEVKKLVGINELQKIKRNSTQLSPEIKKITEEIKVKFPKVGDPKVFTKSKISGTNVDSILLKMMEGDKPYFHVSLFSKNEMPRVDVPTIKNNYLIPEGSGFVEALAYGNMADYSLRQIFKNKDKSFEEVKELLKTDPNLVNSFSAYSLGKNKPESEPTSSPTFNAYFDQFLNDIILTAAKIESEYTGYYITDLSDVIENSALSDEQKAAFYIYSNKLGLIGELDLLAIKPDGTFKVLDIKTTKDEITPTTLKKYVTQVSAYTHILAEVAGLKPEGTADIFVIEKNYRTVMEEIKKDDPSNRRKVIVTDIQKISEPLVSLDELSQKAEDYRKKVLSQYSIADKVVEEPKNQPKRKVLSPYEAIRRATQAKNQGKPLNQEVVESEPLSTKESIKQQAEWLQRVFPELELNKSLLIVPSILSNTGGQFFLDMIILAEKSNEGVGYHEGWHRFSQLYLTKEEKIKLYESARDAKIKFTDRQGNKLNTSSADYLQLEEFLAEEFRKFAQNPNEYKFPKEEVKGIFAKIWEFLKSVLNYFKKGGKNSFEKLFQELHDGTFYKGNYSLDNAIFSRLNSFYRNSKQNGNEVLPNTIFLQYRDFADGYLSEYMLANGDLLSRFLSKKGIAELTNIMRIGFEAIRDNVVDAMNDDNSFELSDSYEELNKILGNEDNPNTFDDFMRAYLKTTNYNTLRTYIGANSDLASRIIEQTVFTPKEEATDKGEEEIENSSESANAEELEYNRGGNEKAATELASDIVKDFFNGITELTISGKIPEGESYVDYSQYNNKGLPKYINKSKAFYKTLEILEGHMTWDLIEQELTNPENYEKFPELQIVHLKLFGENGIITKLDELTDKMRIAQGSEYNDLEEEQRKYYEFKMQFQHVMTLPKVRLETLSENFENSEEENIFDNTSTKKYSPIQTRENSESILTSIVNGFTRGFQENAREEHEDLLKQGESFVDVLDVFDEIMNGQDAPVILGQSKYFYDPVLKLYHFNPFFVSYNFPAQVFNQEISLDKIKEFFKIFGINLNQRAYENSEAAVRKAFDKLKMVSKEYSDYINTQLSQEVVKSNSSKSNKSLANQLKQLRSLDAQLKEAVKADNIDKNKISELESAIFEQRRKLRGIASKFFSTRPVDELLYLGQNRSVRKDDYIKAFAINLPVLLDLAKIQKEYRDHFSSGSMIVGDSTQFSYFLPNQMLILSKLIKYGVKSFDDFDKYPEISHLNPKRNPQFLNNWIIQKLFDKEGKKIPTMNLEISALTLVSRNLEDGTKEEKKFSELNADEKFLPDLLLYRRDGSSEIRRMETSNTAWRMAVVDSSNNNHTFVKPVTIGPSDFKDADFLRIIRGHLQHIVWNYVYDITKEPTSKRREKASLSFFEQMLGSEITSKLKDHIDKKLKENANYNWNNLFTDMQNPDPFEVTEGDKLFQTINDKITDYFEGITITNEDSVLKSLPYILSEKSKDILKDLVNNFRGKTKYGDIIWADRSHISQFSQLLSDPKFQRTLRDFIANDFINAMEDSLTFFGDYSYYKDPIKRRKIIGNNGVLGLTDSSDAEIEKLRIEKGGLLSVYRQAKGLPEDSGKDFRLVRKTIIADMKVESKLIKDGTLLSDLREYYKQRGLNLSDEEIKERKKNIFSAFSEMELADAGAYVSLDLYRKMREKSDNWNDNDEDEYQRQKLILKQKLGVELNDDEQAFIKGGPNSDGSYSSFNVAKFALTGPVYSTEHRSLGPTFDKMGLKVMLPESDWESKRNLFEHMLENAVDYIVYDSGSKGYQTEVHSVWNNNFTQKKVDLTYAEHAAGFLKLQQNTASVKDDSTFAVQLRGTFFSIMELHKKNRVELDPTLKKHYNNFLNSLRDYVSLMGERELSSIGLSKDGNFIKDETGFPIGKRIFTEKIREKLLQIGSTDLSILDKLNVDQNGDFVNFLEALPLHREVYNIVSGILDDGLRKIRLNGSKMYQTMELGSHKLKPEERGTGTIGLNWHGLIKDSDGKIIGISPVEAKIALKKNFYPLLQLEHSDGKKIRTRERLNQMLRDKDWVEQHKNNITMVGIRIPLQDLNFTSHMIIKEFLPESECDSIIVPPEFYKQVGSDNDIDTVTVSFKYLDKATGGVVTKPTESYEYITQKIIEVSERLANKVSVSTSSNDQIKLRLAPLKQRMLQENIFGNENKSVEDLDEELTIVEAEGFKTFKGLLSKKSVLGKALKRGLYQDIITELQDLIEDMNDKQSAFNDKDAMELKNWYKKRNDYTKAINNNIISPIISFLEHPLSFDYLTETDSIQGIEDLAKNLIQLREGKSRDLNTEKAPLDDIGYLRNLVNHSNNAQVRTMLGSFVKFSRLLTTLAQLQTEVNVHYKSASIPDLAKGNTAKFYDRTIWTPLTSRTITDKFQISLYDENGDRITKNLSMVASSLLDLFKNLETFPSLNISWNNIKPLIFLLTQGVPFNKAVTFLNNPITQLIEENKNELGSSYQLRHAVVKTSQDLFADKIHKYKDSEYDKTGYRYSISNINGKESPDQMMKRPAVAAEKYLSEKHGPADFKLNFERVTAFISDFNTFRRGRDTKSTSDLRQFLKTDTGKQYQEVAEDIMAYYTTLIEDGDHFYQMVIKKLDRDSNKYNNKAQIAETQNYEKALSTSQLLNPDFLSKVKTESVFAPFYNDEIVNNVINSIMPEFFNKEIPGWVQGVTDIISKITSEVYGSSETKRRVENKIISDLMEYIYKNFFVFEWFDEGKLLRRSKEELDKKSINYSELSNSDIIDLARDKNLITDADGIVHNFLYEFFEQDILPELSLEKIHDLLYKGSNVKANESTLNTLKGKMEDESLEFLTGYNLFANQIDMFRAKYPELMDLKIVQVLQPKRTTPQLEYEPLQRIEDDENDPSDFDPENPYAGFKKPKQRNITVSEMFNAFSQVYLNMNLSPDPQTRFVEEQQVRDEWNKLMNFAPTVFSNVFDKIVENKREKFYKKPENIAEIRQFFKLLSYYSLVQNSHLDRATGSFAYLAPVDQLKDVVETSLKNFNKYAKGWSDKSVARFLGKFEDLFREMNPELELRIPDRGVPYRREKVKSGKLYSKVTIEHTDVQIAKDSLFKQASGTLGYNNFLINPNDIEKDAFTDKC